jgi:hypothetical protein
MRGTSSLGDKFTGDFGNESETTSISDLDLLCLLARKSPLSNFGLLQQYRHKADMHWLVAYSLGGKTDRCKIGAHDDIASEAARLDYFLVVGFSQWATRNFVRSMADCPN